jgi:hypothetical protein
MAITLPTDPAPNGAEPFRVSFDGVLTPFLGGPVQSIGRLGTRLGLRVSYPPMRGAIARQFQARLLRGQTERVLLEWPLLDLDPGNPPAPAINATSAGTAIAVKGLGAGYIYHEGQPLSVVHAGRRYTHIVTGNGAADGSGNAAMGIYPPSRVTYSVNDTVEIAQPIIEGLVNPGEEWSWGYALEHTMDFSFSVVETA